MVCTQKHPIWRQAKFVSSRRPDDIDDLARHLGGINVLDKTMEGLLQGRLAHSFLNVVGRSRGNHRTLTEDQQVGADSFHHFQHVEQ